MRIKKSLLEMLLVISRENHPHEIVALLTGKKEIAEELIILPFEGGRSSAIIHMEMLPLGMRIIGTFHNHPSPDPYPSSADLDMFSKYGKYHIIIAYPYTMDSWRCFDKGGREIKAEVIEE